MSSEFPLLPELEQVQAPDATASSCFHKLEVCEHISLLPCFVGRLSQGISEHLSKKLLRYSEHYGGVLLAYSKPCVQQALGRILDEQPHIHFDLTYTAYVFRPVVGSVVCGTVNNVGGDHVGCLVYDCFNASVFSTKRGGKGLKKLNGAFTSKFMVGSKVWFRVVSTENVSGILSIIGEYFDPTEVYRESPLALDYSVDATVHSSGTGDDDSSVHTKKKKRKAKRTKTKKDEDSDDLLGGNQEEMLSPLPLPSSVDTAASAGGSGETSEHVGKRKRNSKHKKIAKDIAAGESVDCSQGSDKEPTLPDPSVDIVANSVGGRSSASKKKKDKRLKIKLEEELEDLSQSEKRHDSSVGVTALSAGDAKTSSVITKKNKQEKSLKRDESVSATESGLVESGVAEIVNGSKKSRSRSKNLELKSDRDKRVGKKRQHSDCLAETPKKKRRKLTDHSHQL